MKIYLSKPRNHWLSPYTILEKVIFWREIDYDERIIEKWNYRLEPFCKVWQKFLDFIHPEIQYVKIDCWDTWSMDHSLAPIILAMLKQLKESKHGSPNVDDEDVPDRLKSTSAPPKENEWDTDEYWHERWDWVLDQMIWSFAQLCDDSHENAFYDHSEVKEKDDFNLQIQKIKVDHDGLNNHNARIDRGLRLFGKYYRALWD